MGRAAHFYGLEAEEPAHPVVLVDHEVADLEIAEVREEAAGTAAGAPEVEVHLLGEDVAVGEHGEAASRQLEASGEGAHPGEDARPLADRQAPLAEHVLQTVRASGVPEEEHRDRAGPVEVRGQPPQVARIGGHRPRSEMEAALLGIELTHLDRGGRDQAGEKGLRAHETLLGLEGKLAPAALAVLAGPLQEGLGLRAHRLGLENRHRALPEMLPGRHGGPRHEGQQLHQAFGNEAAVQALQEGRALAPRREALDEARLQAGERGARGEDVGKGERGQGLQGFHGALGLGVEGAEALHRVPQELETHRQVAVRGEEIEDPAAPRHLPGGGDGILPNVASLVERLQQDLRRHLLPHAQGQHPRFQQGGGEAGAEKARGGGHDRAQAATAGGQEGRRTAQRGVGVAGKTAVGWGAGRGEGEDRPRAAGFPGQGAEVPGHLVDFLLVGDHDEERRFRQEQGEETPGGSHQARQRDAAVPGEGLRGLPEAVGPPQQSERAFARGGARADRLGPHRRRTLSRIALVERPGTISTRTTRPPAASTSFRPTIASGAQSAPLTSTSGTTARITRSGVGSS